jgi:hypothetical protein
MLEQNEASLNLPAWTGNSMCPTAKLATLAHFAFIRTKDELYYRVEIVRETLDSFVIKYVEKSHQDKTKCNLNSRTIKKSEILEIRELE